MLSPRLLTPDGILTHFREDGTSSVLFSPLIEDSIFHLYFTDQGTRTRILSHSDCLQGTLLAKGFKLSTFPNPRHVS